MTILFVFFFLLFSSWLSCKWTIFHCRGYFLLADFTWIMWFTVISHGSGDRAAGQIPRLPQSPPLRRKSFFTPTLGNLEWPASVSTPLPVLPQWTQEGKGLVSAKLKCEVTICTAGSRAVSTHSQDVHAAASGVWCSGIQSESYAAGTAGPWSPQSAFGILLYYKAGTQN